MPGAGFVRASEVRRRDSSLIRPATNNTTVSNPPTTVPIPLDRVRDSDVGQGQVSALTLAQLRDLRRRLRAESERAAYWHRLAKARLDLVVAGALEGNPVLGPVPGDRPATTSVGSPLDCAPNFDAPCFDAPCFDALRELLLSDDGPSADVVDRLHQIDDAERQLREYGSSVRAAADEATGELVRRYHDEPATCLLVVPRPA